MNIQERPWLTYTAIAVNVVLFLVSIAVNRGVEDWMLSPSPSTLLRMGGFSLDTAARKHEVWRIFTSDWLHGNVFHIGMNMLALYSLAAQTLEAEYGRVRLATMYVFSGMFGSIAMGVTTPTRDAYDVGIGASGALFGLSGALISEMITNWQHYSDKVMVLRFHGHDGPTMGRVGRLVFLIGSTIVGLLLVAFFPHVSTSAHIGGLIAGFLLGFILLAKGHQETILPVSQVKKGGEYSKRQRMGFVGSLALLVVLYGAGLAFMYGRHL